MSVPTEGRSQLALSTGLAAAAFVVFALLPQRTLHGFDSDWYATLLAANDLQRPTAHVAYLPLCKLALAVVRPFGGGAVHAMWLAAALGSAIGVFCLHRAALRLVDTRIALVVPIAVALTPACFYFATAAEIHGVFAAGSGAAWWLFARWRTNARAADAIALGAGCGAAATIHAFGHLLPVMFVAIALVQRVPLRRVVLHAPMLALAHAGVALAVAFLLGHGAFGQAGAATSMLATWWRANGLGAVLDVLWRECFVPFLPWTVVVWFALRDAVARPWSLAYGVALLLHAPVACVLLAAGGENFYERGGYLLPTAVPAVLATAVLLRGAKLWLGVAAAAALTAGFVVPRWPPRYRAEFVAAITALAHEQPSAFLVDPAEIEGLRTHCGDVVAAEVVRSMAAFHALTDASPTPVPISPWFDAMLGALGGERSWFVTEAAQRCFAESPSPAARELWAKLPERWLLEPVQRSGLRAVRLRRR